MHRAPPPTGRGVRPKTTGTVYGDVTLLAVRLRATEGISSGVSNLISVDATRKLDGSATRDPSEAVLDAYTDSVYGGRRPAAEMDSDALAEIAAAAAGHDGFNYRFTAQRSLWDAVRAIVLPLRYYPVPIGGLISFALDGVQAVISVAFGAQNMHDVQVLHSWDRSDATDGFEVAYTDDQGRAQSVLSAPDVADPERVELEGCTDADTAQDYADGLWRRRLYRREYLTWRTELQGHVVPIGARVSVDYPLVGAGSWIVQQVRTISESETELSAWRYDARQYP